MGAAVREACVDMKPGAVIVSTAVAVEHVTSSKLDVPECLVVIQIIRRVSWLLC
jgi:hypothetical protein